MRVVSARRLELSHEWGSFALREVDTGDRLDPADLPMPESLATRLTSWSARWDTTFDLDRPDRPKVDRWVLDELARDGARLWRAVLTVLPAQSYEVVYRHDDTLYRRVEELPDHWRLA